jgi:hypothetical protein
MEKSENQFFVCCEMNSSHFFLIVGFPTETNFHTSRIELQQGNNFIFTALKLW